MISLHGRNFSEKFYSSKSWSYTVSIVCIWDLGKLIEASTIWSRPLSEVAVTSFAAGIQVSHGVCYHGLAINCNTALHWYQHITPCGVEGKDVTSLSEMCGRTVHTGQVEHILTQNLASSVGFKIS